MAAAPLPPLTSSANTPEAAPLSEGARSVNTFIAPSKTFTDLRRNASWWGPWLLISIVSPGSGGAGGTVSARWHRIGMHYLRSGRSRRFQ
jgi:hypothetical protein